MTDLPVTRVRGVNIDLAAYRFDADDSMTVNLLVHELEVLAGRLSPGGINGYTLNQHEQLWRTLCDVDAAAVERVVRKIERSSDWRLPGDPGEHVLDRIDAYFAGAMARRRAELAAAR